MRSLDELMSGFKQVAASVVAGIVMKDVPIIETWNDFKNFKSRELVKVNYMSIRSIPKYYSDFIKNMEINFDLTKMPGSGGLPEEYFQNLAVAIINYEFVERKSFGFLMDGGFSGKGASEFELIKRDNSVNVCKSIAYKYESDAEQISNHYDWMQRNSKI